MMLWSLLCIVLVLLGLGSVAFVTLLERKLLGLSQVRLGPNKVSLNGLLQPVADGVKLLLKETLSLNKGQTFLFTFSPILVLFMFMVIWAWVVPWWGTLFSMKYSSLLFFSLLGIGAYAVILVGWSGSSAFSKLGSVRGVLQSLSFEVALILTFLSILAQNFSLNLMNMSESKIEFNFIWCILWFILALMETNRAPFDLLEGESELISGFNIELGSLPFVFLFLSEYGMIIVMMIILVVPVISLGSSLIFFVSLLLFMRSCYPRVRYDILMSLMWLSMLPVSIVLFFSSSFLI